MALQSYTLVLTVVIVLLSTYGTNLSAADTDKDKEECQEPLVGLAPCLPYVGGNAKTPTLDCCSGLKQILKTNKKCLCVVVKNRNDPDLGLNINVTLALGLPSVCHAPANVSACPDLLKLPPNSPEAQVFYQFGNGSKNAASSPAPSPSSNNAKSEGTSTSQKRSSGTNSGFVWRFYFGIFLQFTLVGIVGIDL